MTAEVTAKLKDAWESVGKAFAKQPLIFIDDKGKCWLNGHAKEFISKRRIPVRDLLEWLKIGSMHLQNLSYRDVGFLMMNLPGNNVVAILKEKAPNGNNDKTRLTSKEREILRYLVKGYSNKEIASSMKIRPSTVNAHLDKIYLKLGCSNRVAASFLALKNGLFLPESEHLSNTSRS
jgi:DNA-binding NarL/FixJ family response regulator